MWRGGGEAWEEVAISNKFDSLMFVLILFRVRNAEVLNICRIFRHSIRSDIKVVRRGFEIIIPTIPLTKRDRNFDLFWAAKDCGNYSSASRSRRFRRRATVLYYK